MSSRGAASGSTCGKAFAAISRRASSRWSAASPTLDAIEDDSVDFAFASNLFEHIPQDALVAVLAQLRAKLTKRGTLTMLQPNYRYAYREYFDDYTHVAIYSHISLADLLVANGWEVIEVKPRFLPLTVKSRLPVSQWLIALYLALPVQADGQADADPRASEPPVSFEQRIVAPGAKRARLWVVGVFALALIAQSWVFWQFLSESLGAIRFPGELDYGEGIVWEQMRLMIAGRGYGAIDGLPAIVFHYPPVFHALTAALSSLTGFDQLAVGRSVSFGSTLLIGLFAGLIAATTVRADAPRRTAIICGLVATLATFCFSPDSLLGPADAGRHAVDRLDLRRDCSRRWLPCRDRS